MGFMSSLRKMGFEFEKSSYDVKWMLCHDDSLFEPYECIDLKMGREPDDNILDINHMKNNFIVK